MEDVLAMLKLQYMPKVKLYLGGKDHSDQEFCRTLKLAECLLVTLNLSDTSFSGDGLSGMNVNLQQLEEVCLAGCHHLTDTGLRNVLTASGSSLKQVWASNTRISGATFEGLQLPKLESLNLGSCWKLTDTGIRKLRTNSGSNIKLLILPGTRISDAALLGVRLPKLEILDLSFCENLKDRGVHEFLKTNSANLTFLNLVNACVSGTMLINWIKHYATRQLKTLRIGSHNATLRIADEEYEDDEVDLEKWMLKGFLPNCSITVIAEQIDY